MIGFERRDEGYLYNRITNWSKDRFTEDDIFYFFMQNIPRYFDGMKDQWRSHFRDEEFDIKADFTWHLIDASFDHSRYLITLMIQKWFKTTHDYDFNQETYICSIRKDEII